MYIIQEFGVADDAVAWRDDATIYIIQEFGVADDAVAFVVVLGVHVCFGRRQVYCSTEGIGLSRITSIR